MPSSVFLRFLPPDSEFHLPSFAGKKIHAGFLRMIACLDPQLADKLHSSSTRRPYTLAPALMMVRSPDRQSGERPGLRITCLTPEMENCLSRAAKEKVFLRLGNTRLRVHDIVDSAHPMVGKTSYRRLMHPTNGNSSGGGKLHFVFHTPTTFRSKKGNELFPLPSLVFHGLLLKWQIFSDVPMPCFPSDFAADIFDGLLRPCRYCLETEIVDYSTYRQIGFTGFCRYELNGELAENERKALLALARYSLFAGTGYKTTMGLGQTSVTLK